MTTKELLALVAAATPGPWEVLGDNQGHPCGLEWTIEAPHLANDEDTGWIAGRHGGDGIASTGNPGCRADAELIVAAVNALPALCAEVEALRKDAERYRWLLTHAVTMSFDSEGSLETGEWHSIADNVGDEDRTLDMVIDAAKEPK